MITGGSSGIGKSIAKGLFDSGWIVYELSRSGESAEGILHISADVSKEDQVKMAFAEIFAAEGSVNLLVNNAGMGISGAVEYTETESAKRLFDVNFFGSFICAREAIAYLRRSENPQIINISSVAAVFSIPYQSFYSASKAAINSLTLTLANELKSFGIRVNGVMPGDVKTGFTAAREKSEDGKELYGSAISRAVGVMEKDETTGMPPEKVAQLVIKLAHGRASGKLYVAGGKYKLFVFLGKLLPTSLANRLVASMYK